MELPFLPYGSPRFARGFVRLLAAREEPVGVLGFRVWSGRTEVPARALRERVRALLLPRKGEWTMPFDEGSAVPDLLGLRHALPGLRARLAHHVRDLDALLRRHPLARAPLAREVDLALLAEATRAAAARDDLAGKEPGAVAARVAAMAVGAPRVGVRRAGELLGISRPAAYRLAGEAPDRDLVSAIVKQLSVRTPAPRPVPALVPPPPGRNPRGFDDD